MDGPLDEAAASADFQRELAARRKDLQREFDEKMRDLKAQEKRRADRLEQDRIEWEQHRREKTKELADREHALKGRERRTLPANQAGMPDRSELSDLRAKVADLVERRDALANRHAGLEAKVAKAEARSKVRWWRLVAVVCIAITAGLVWLVLALKQGGGTRVVPSLVFLALVVAATAWPARTQRRNP